MYEEEKEKAQQNEHQAWLDMFNLMADTFGVPVDKLNQNQYRPLFVSIERWAYFDRQRRKAVKGADKWPGLFYEGE